MMINFFISSVITMGVGALSDKIGLERTYAISAFLAFPAIIFAFFVPRKEKSVPD